MSLQPSLKEHHRRPDRLRRRFWHHTVGDDPVHRYAAFNFQFTGSGSRYPPLTTWTGRSRRRLIRPRRRLLESMEAVGGRLRGDLAGRVPAARLSRSGPRVSDGCCGAIRGVNVPAPASRPADDQRQQVIDIALDAPGRGRGRRDHRVGHRPDRSVVAVGEEFDDDQRRVNRLEYDRDFHRRHGDDARGFDDL